MTARASTLDVQDVAAGMLARYSSLAVAMEMAHWHAMDYPEGDPRRVRWQAVGRKIRELAIARCKRASRASR